MSPRRGLVAIAALGASVLFVRPSAAEVEAHLVRVEASGTDADGYPIVTTLVELGKSRRVADASLRCASLSGNSRWACLGSAFEKPGALFEPAAFDEAHAELVLDGAARPAILVRHAAWSKSGNEARI